MAKWRVDTYSTWVGFGNIWRMLANVGNYLGGKVHRYESKFGRKQEFLPVDFDNLSADFFKSWSLCNVIWLSV